ncbi:MAG: cytochrome c oxidase subunit II [Actinomycetota bacterium]
MSARHKLAGAALVFAAGVLLAACSDTLPQSSLNPAGERAEQVDSLFRLVFWIAVGVFVLVEGALVYALIRFRQRRADDPNPVQVHGNTRLEIIWTIIPALLLLGIAIPTIRTTFDLSEHPTGEGVVAVIVTASQWWWEVEYPDLGVVTANEIHVPVGSPVTVELHSKDVIHSFWVPRLAGKQDVVPGRTISLDFVAAAPGVFPGQCAEYCGLSHANMRFIVVAEEPEDFDQWVADQRAPAVAAPPGTENAEGEELFRSVGCVACHTVAGLEGAQGILGPDLTHFGGRTTFAGSTFEINVANLTRWLRNPLAMKPGSRMPSYNLTDDQIEALIAYLMSLE